MNNCECCNKFINLFPCYDIGNKILEYYGTCHKIDDLEYSDSIDINYNRTPNINELDSIIIDFSIFCKNRNLIKKYNIMFSEFFYITHYDLDEIINIINKYNLKINFKGTYNKIYKIPEKLILFFDDNKKLVDIFVDMEGDFSILL